MPSIRYINQTAPFWDFIANMEREGTNHPLFGGSRQQQSNTNDNEDDNTFPWGLGPWGMPGGFPFRGPPPHHRHGHHHGPPPPHHGGPPPPHHSGPPPPPPPGPGDDVPPPPFEEKEGTHDPFAPEKGEPSTGKSPQHEDGDNTNRHGRCGGPGAWGRGRRGPCGARRRGGSPPWARGGFPFNAFLSQFNPTNTKDSSSSSSDTNFTPPADVFDTDAAFVIHLSLPGAKKEDISVSWDSDKSELCVAGFVHRPGDEELLKTLAMDEREVGLFERKIRLGSLANPAQVEVDGIVARLEEGILRVEVPKLDRDYVEVKMVDIE